MQMKAHVFLHLIQISSRGFTLIELLVVIAIIGVMSTAVLAAVNPIDKIYTANEAKVQTDIAVLGNAAEAYAVSNSGNYPPSIAAMVGSDIKVAPSAPTGYNAYLYTASASGTMITITCGPLKSKKYSGKYWRYESSTGKKCAVGTIGQACPP